MTDATDNADPTATNAHVTTSPNRCDHFAARRVARDADDGSDRRALRPIPHATGAKNTTASENNAAAAAHHAICSGAISRR